jgi:chromosome segregation ATPase
MEIRIKTAEEFWRDKVSIEISGTAAEVQTVGQQITRGRTAGYWATAAERAERRVRELEEERAADAGTIEGLRDRLADVEATLLTAHQAREIETRRAQEYDRDRHTERDRADRAEADLKRLRAEMERRFTLGQVEDAKAGAREDARAEIEREKVQPLELEVAALADLLGKVNGLMLGSEIRQALDGFSIAPVGYDILATAVRKVRELLGVSWDGKAPRAPREV